MEAFKSIEFPCLRLPEEVSGARLLGLYPQAQEGYWMQRVKITGGLLSGAQWRALSNIMREFTPDTPLHLTTRQDIELHDIRGEQVPSVQKGLARAGLSGVGACGDTLRNITVCSCSGLFAGAVDLHPLAKQMRQELEGWEGIYRLPRKFKISLSCGREGCDGQPWINDLGFMAQQKNGERSFTVTAGGSLGVRPGTAMKLFDELKVGEVLALARAAVEIFHENGDRENRRRARLRHVRERWGDEAFSKLLKERWEAVKKTYNVKPVELKEPGKFYPACVTLTFAQGDVRAEAAEALAELAEGDNNEVRIANQHRVLVLGRDKLELGRRIDKSADLQQAATERLSIVACPGSRYCRRGLTDTAVLANSLRAELTGKTEVQRTICISGCPNSCAHSGVADIGLIGGLAGRGDERQEVYNILMGGGMGRSDILARQVAAKLPVDKTVDKVKELLNKRKKFD